MIIGQGGQTAPPNSQPKQAPSNAKSMQSANQGGIPSNAPLNTILTIGLMIALLWAGIALFRKDGAAKLVGGLLLLILLKDVLDTSNKWLGYFNSFNRLLQNGFTGLEALKNVSGS